MLYGGWRNGGAKLFFQNYVCPAKPHVFVRLRSVLNVCGGRARSRSIEQVYGVILLKRKNGEKGEDTRIYFEHNETQNSESIGFGFLSSFLRN